MELSTLIRARMESPTPLYDSKGNEFSNIVELFNIVRGYLETLPSFTRPVGIMLPKEPQFVLLMLACMERGIPYVPLSVGTPEERLADIVEDADIQSVIRQENFDAILSRGKISDKLADRQLPAEHPLYIIFTSGSTGRPKGVAISRGAFKAYSDWLVDYLGDSITEDDRVLQITEFTFDISLIDIILYLRKGTPLYFSGFNNIIVKLAQEIELKQITAFSTVPNNMTMLLSDLVVKKSDFSRLRTLMVGGARFSYGLYQKISQHCRGLDIHNFYGPTEFTIYCHAKKMTFDPAQDVRDHTVSIGLPNTQVQPEILVDDRFGEAIEQGELILSGAQIMNGYVNNSEKTAEAITEIQGRKFYKTGDLAYKDDRGEYFIVGRLDDTIKVRGYRVNLLDIDSYIARLDFVQDVTTIAIPDEIRENLTVCYLIPKADVRESLKIVDVKRKLKEVLMDYQVPDKVVFTDRFPTNTSGKVCKKTLAAQFLESQK